MANWEKLDHDLLVEIANRILSLPDYVLFRGVCTSFRSAAPPAKKTIPLLMLPPKKDSHVLDFFNPSKGTTLQVILPFETSGKMFSSKGFLISIEQDLSVNLFNPFSCQRIKLPRLEIIEYICPHGVRRVLEKPAYARKHTFKCVLSSTPLFVPDYITMVIHGDRGELSYIRAGDDTWTPIKTWCGRYQDITFYEGQFYAVNCLGMVMALNIKRDDLSETEQVAEFPPSIEEFYNQFYVVESEGSLLMVARCVSSLNGDENSPYGTWGFKVFNVDLRANKCTVIKDLGDRVLFLGYSSSFSCAAHLYNCKPNSIYFTHDFLSFEIDGRVGKHMGIYSLEDESITDYFDSDLLLPNIPSMWVELSMI